MILIYKSQSKRCTTIRLRGNDTYPIHSYHFPAKNLISNVQNASIEKSIISEINQLETHERDHNNETISFTKVMNKHLSVSSGQQAIEVKGYLFGYHSCFDAALTLHLV